MISLKSKIYIIEIKLYFNSEKSHILFSAFIFLNVRGFLQQKKNQNPIFFNLEIYNISCVYKI